MIYGLWYVGRRQLYITYIIYSAIITTKDLFFSVVANVICPLALMMATSSVGESCCTSSFCKLIEQGDDVLISQITWLVILLTFIFMVLINTVVFKCRKVPEAKKASGNAYSVDVGDFIESAPAQHRLSITRCFIKKRCDS